jgi:hypothetical protein
MTTMYDEHPCNICQHSDKCFEIGCPLENGYNLVNVCQQYDCFLNYEGSCKISVYDKCGSRMTADGTVPEEEYHGRLESVQRRKGATMHRMRNVGTVRALQKEDRSKRQETDRLLPELRQKNGIL